jgi:hypothetical protein
MAAFWVEMGVAYLEINKLPCLQEIDTTQNAAILTNDGKQSLKNTNREHCFQ